MTYRVASRLWARRLVFVAIFGALVFLLFDRRRIQHASPLSAKVAKDSRDDIYEEKIALPSFTGPFRCPIDELPGQVRMRTIRDQGIGVFVHGFKDRVGDMIWVNGAWEGPRLKSIVAYLRAIRSIDKTRDAFLDIGANVGLHTVQIAAEGLSVHSFEPIEANGILVRCSLAFNNIMDRVRVNTFAVGDRAGRFCMTSPTGKYGDSMVDMTAHCGPESRIPMGTMNNYYQKVLQGKQKIAVMKISLRGFEVGAMRSATALFDGEEVPPVVFFDYDIALSKVFTNTQTFPHSANAVIQDHGYNSIELVNFFHSRGFDLYRDTGQNSSAIAPSGFDGLGLTLGQPLAINLVALNRGWKTKLEAAGFLLQGGTLIERNQTATPSEGTDSQPSATSRAKA
ncbi:hypothetical protein ANO11243_092520 [Dothideomycetidae sp. 11243]|nr:hypothetical protein ANO11243_092520 [fungal sp. No.11243]